MTITRRLTEAERESAKEILVKTREQIAALAGDDAALLWAVRRYVYKQLLYDERGKPMDRKMLKQRLMGAQDGRCRLCGEELPERGAELDRLDPMKGYTLANTRLLCHKCHRQEQERKGFA
jgi:hypothetical protein